MGEEDDAMFFLAISTVIDKCPVSLENAFLGSEDDMCCVVLHCTDKKPRKGVDRGRKNNNS